MLGILDDGTIMHVVVRLTELRPAHVFSAFALCWMNWVGPPRRVTLDYMGGFLGTFRGRMEKLGADLDYVPPDAHQELGRIEKRNHVWRGVDVKTVDAMQLIGPADMDIWARWPPMAR